MKAVWKYPIQVDTGFNLDLPVGYKIIHVEVQGHQPCIWVEAQGISHTESVHFEVYGTGRPIPDHLEHVSTFQHGHFVWHLYRRRQDA